MRPEDLYLKVAEQFQPRSYSVFDSAERKRLDELQLGLKQRAAKLMDRIFEHFSDDRIMASTYDATGTLRRFDVIDKNSNAWSGESKVAITPDEYGDLKELTRSWVAFEVPAEDEFDVFAPDGFYVRKRVLVGMHDLRLSTDDGETWSESDRCASLEVITGLFIEPEDAVGYTELKEDLEDGKIQNPFEDGPIILERLNHKYPIFDDSEPVRQVGFSEVAKEHHYPTPHALIEAIHASLDDLEKALG